MYTDYGLQNYVRLNNTSMTLRGYNLRPKLKKIKNRNIQGFTKMVNQHVFQTHKHL